MTTNAQGSGITLSPNRSPEYLRGVLARIQWLVDDRDAGDGPEPALPVEPEPSRFWAGWNFIVRIHPTSGQLDDLLGQAIQATRINVSQVGNIVTLTQGDTARERHMRGPGPAIRLASRLRKTASTRQAEFASWGAGDE